MGGTTQNNGGTTTDYDSDVIDLAVYYDEMGNEVSSAGYLLDADGNLVVSADSELTDAYTVVGDDGNTYTVASDAQIINSMIKSTVDSSQGTDTVDYYGNEVTSSGYLISAADSDVSEVLIITDSDFTITADTQASVYDSDGLEVTVGSADGTATFEATDSDGYYYVILNAEETYYTADSDQLYYDGSSYYLGTTASALSLAESDVSVAEAYVSGDNSWDVSATASGTSYYVLAEGTVSYLYVGDTSLTASSNVYYSGSTYYVLGTTTIALNDSGATLNTTSLSAETVSVSVTGGFASGTVATYTDIDFTDVTNFESNGGWYDSDGNEVTELTTGTTVYWVASGSSASTFSLTIDSDLYVATSTSKATLYTGSTSTLTDASGNTVTVSISSTGTYGGYQLAYDENGAWVTATSATATQYYLATSDAAQLTTSTLTEVATYTASSGVQYTSSTTDDSTGTTYYTNFAAEYSYSTYGADGVLTDADGYYADSDGNKLAVEVENVYYATLTGTYTDANGDTQTGTATYYFGSTTAAVRLATDIFCRNSRWHQRGFCRDCGTDPRDWHP